MLLEDLVEEFLYDNQARGHTKKTLINKRHEFKHFLQFMHDKRGIKEMESVTLYDLKSYVQHKQRSGLTPQSIVSMAKIIKAFFNWCVKEEYLKENLMDKVTLPKVPKQVISGFTPDEVAKMIDAFTYKDYLETRNKAIVAMLADCGLRSMEIRGLKDKDVIENTILVNGKGNKQRYCFISPTLKRILIKYERAKKAYLADKLVKADNYFLTYQADEMSHIALYNLVKEAGRRAGIEGKRVSPHTFRHFYSVQSLNSGNIDVYSLSRLLGHSDVATTTRYLSSMTDAQLLDKAITSSPLTNLNRMRRD